MQLSAAVGAGHDAREAAHALAAVDHDRAVCDAQRAGDAALHAQRVGAVAAGDGEGDVVALLDADARDDVAVLERLDHRGFAGIGKRAVVFAQVAAEAPLFIDVNPFHMQHLTLRRA